MFHPKVGSVFRALESQSRDIRTELDSLMSSISDWADGLLETVEKEHRAGAERVFLLPKTPNKRNTRNRKPPKNTGLPMETNDMDKTIPDRGRTTRRGAKMSKMNITKDMNLIETMQTTLVIEENKSLEKTVVLQANTRPVLRSKQPEVAVPGQETTVVKNENNELNIPGGSFKRESPPEKVGTSEHVSRSRVTRSCKSPRESLIIGIADTPVSSSGRRRLSKTLGSSPLSSKKICRNLSSGPVLRSSSVIINRTSSKSPVMRSRSLRSSMNASRSPATRNSTNKSVNNKSTVSSNQKDKDNTPESRSNLGNRVAKKELTPLAASTFIVVDDTLGAEEITPVVKEGRISRFNKTSTRSIGVEKTYVVNAGNCEESVHNVAEGTPDLFASSNADNLTEESTQDAEIPKKKRKLKKKEEMKENIEDMGDTMRITRTKSKALKEKMENASKQADLSAMAKKLVNKAKMTKVRKSQLDVLLESNLPCGNLSSSKSKYHLLVASSKDVKTPLGPLPNSMRKMAKTTADKDQSRPKVAGRDNSVESTTRSATKPLNPDLVEKEMKLKSKIEKEKNAELKRQTVMKNKQVELKRKNELKHQLAMKQREKLEQEKYYNMIQLEKEKEERHKLLLEERRMKLKEEIFKKKMLTQQKIAETGERRRLEEEARIAKLKEMEAEEQRLALEKQKEQERLEKRAQERLAQKKAREEYEMQQRQELEAERLRTEKVLSKKCLASGSKFQSASKRPKLEIATEKREWDYKPRNEDDYGLEDENSEVDSDDEKPYDNVKPPKHWAKKILQKKSHVLKHITLEMLNEFMTCHRKSPDVNKMFEITPSKHIKRSSSAIWHTPSS